MEQFFNDYFDRLQDLHKQIIDVLDALPDTAVNWQAIPDEAHYLGEAKTFVDQVLQAVENSVKLDK